MSRVIFALLALLAVASAFPQKQVGSTFCDRINEEYSYCAYNIEPTCEYPNLRSTVTYCIPGCQCKPGLVRKFGRECVPPYLCNDFPFAYSKSKS